MTLPYSASIATFLGNGIATEFPFSFKVWTKAQLQVFVVRPDGVMEDLPFTATLTDTGGTVRALYNGGPLLPGWKLSIVRDMPFAQEVDLVSGTRFDPQVLEDALDAAAAERQQLRETLERAVVVPPGSEEPPEILADLIFEARDVSLASAASARGSEGAAAASAGLAQEVVAGGKGAINAAKDRAVTEINTLADTRTTQLATLAAQSTAEFTNLSDGRSSQFTALAVLKNGEITALANNINIVGNATLADIVTRGDTQASRLNATADTAVSRVTELGEQQQSKITQLGTEYVGQAREGAITSIQEAARAEAAAQRAVDMTGVGLASKTNFGLARVGSGLEVVDGVISVSIRRLLTLPVLDFVGQGAIGYSYSLSMSCSTSVEGAAIDYFTLFVDGEAEVRVPASNGMASYTILVQGIDGATGTIVVRATDTAKNDSDEKTITYIKRLVSLRAPRILQPVEGSADVALSPLLGMQAFALNGNGGIVAQPSGTQIRLASDAGFTDIIYDTGKIAYCTEHTVDKVLEASSEFFVQARHEGGQFGWSAYGESTRFTTIAKTVLAPQVVSPPNASTGQSVEPVLVLTALQSTGIVDTPVASHVQVAQDLAFSSVVFDSTENGVYSTSVQVPRLQQRSRYYARARHKGLNIGWSPWSLASSFETLEAFVHVPEILAPEEGTTTDTLTPVLDLSAFVNTGPPDSPAGRQIQISSSALFTPLLADTGINGPYTQQYTCPSLPLNTRVFCRVRDMGHLWGQSAWSAIRAFTTVNAWVNKPHVQFSDAQEAQSGVTKTLYPVFLFSAFSYSGPTDMPANTHCQIARDPDFTNIFFDSGENAPYATAIRWANPSSPSNDMQYPQALGNNTQYYIRVRHKGTLWGWSPWSPYAGEQGELGFRTVHIYVHTPSVLSPAEGSTSATLRPVFTFAAFSNAGPPDTPVNTHFQLSRTADFTSLVEDSGEVGGYCTTFQPASLLPMGTALYARVRHRALLWGWSPWSAVLHFNTMMSSLNAVNVTQPVAGSSLLQADVALACPAMTGVGEVGAHVATQWLITNTDGATLYDSGWDTVNLRAVRVPVVPAGAAKIFVRHKSALVQGQYGTGVSVTFTTALGQLFEVMDSGVWTEPSDRESDEMNMGVAIHDKNFYCVGDWVYVDGVKRESPLKGEKIRHVVKSHNGRLVFHSMNTAYMSETPGKVFLMSKNLTYVQAIVNFGPQDIYRFAPLGYQDEDNLLFKVTEGVACVHLPSLNVHLVTESLFPGTPEFYCIYEHPFVYAFGTGYGLVWNILNGEMDYVDSLVPEGGTPQYIYAYEEGNGNILYAYLRKKALAERVRVSFGSDVVDFSVGSKYNSALSGRVAYCNGRTYLMSSDWKNMQIVVYVSDDGLNFRKCHTAPQGMKGLYQYLGSNNDIFIAALGTFSGTPLKHLVSKGL